MRLLLFVFLVFISCKKEINSTEILDKNLKEIELIKSSKKEVLSNYVDDIRVIKLKTDFNLIEINKVVYFKDNYYVLDKKTSQLIIFDNNGNFIRKIGKRGGGPGEYKKITDFEIDKINELILVLSNYDRAVYKYNTKGEFIDRVRLDFFINGFVLTQNGNYVFMSGRSGDTFHTLTTTDSDGKILGMDFPFPKDIPIKSFAYTGGLHKQGFSNYFTEATSSRIYKIENDISLLYNFNFGKNTWKEENRFDLNKFINTGLKNPISHLTNFYCDTKDILAFQFIHKKYYRKGFYFKSTGKVLGVPFNLEDDYLYRLIYLPVGIKDNSFISPLNYELYEEIISEKEGDDLKELNPYLYSQLKEFSENDNPYLLIYDVKNN